MHFDDIEEKDPMLTQEKHKNIIKRLFFKLDLYIMLVMIAVVTPIVGSTFVLITKHCQELVFRHLLFN